MRTVAVDAMGGDHAPAPEVDGAVAARESGLARVVLVGDEARLKGELARWGGAPEGLTLHHASDVITMDDHPGVAAKSKRDSSMRVAFDLCKQGKVDAVVSAGNSGAMMACGLFVMKRLSGVDRPGIVTTFPTADGVCALMDMGANVECRPQTLAQFAVLGAVYARALHRKSRPRVGLLSNGEEAMKGTELTRGAPPTLSAPSVHKDFEYVGYVEGRDIFGGEIDVVVTRRIHRQHRAQDRRGGRAADLAAAQGRALADAARQIGRIPVAGRVPALQEEARLRRAGRGPAGRGRRGGHPVAWELQRQSDQERRAGSRQLCRGRSSQCDFRRHRAGTHRSGLPRRSRRAGADNVHAFYVHSPQSHYRDRARTARADRHQ